MPSKKKKVSPDAWRGVFAKKGARFICKSCSFTTKLSGAKLVELDIQGKCPECPRCQKNMGRLRG